MMDVVNNEKLIFKMYLSEKLAEKLNDFFVVCRQVEELDAVLEHALLLRIFGHHLDNLKSD